MNKYFNSALAVTMVILLFNSCAQDMLLLTDTKVDGKFMIPYSVSGITTRVNLNNVKLLDNKIFDTIFQFEREISIPSGLYIDSSQNSTTSSFKLNFLIGKKGSDLYFVGDTNFDNDFNTDSLVVISNFYADTMHTWLNQFNDKISYTFSITDNNLKVNPLHLPITIDIAKSPTNSIANRRLQMSLTFTNENSYKVSEFKISGKKHFAVIDNLPVAKIWGTERNKVYIINESNPLSKNMLNRTLGYLSNDTVRLEKRDWVITLLDDLGDSIKLTKVPKRKSIIGVTENVYIPPMSFKEMNSDNIISLASPLKKNVTALIFWGTWCGPCMRKMPEYNLLYDSINKSSVDMIGVCWDRSEDSVYIKEAFINNKIVWPNIFSELYSTTNTIANKLRIEPIPLYILLDQQGKITYRGGDLEKVKEMLLNPVK